jgi:methyl-accepting chemotaxis protein
MADLDQVEAAVDKLNSLTSSIFKFNGAFGLIENASRDTDNDELGRLREILSAFRGKLPDLVTHNRLRANAKDLADNLMLTTLAQRIARINARNEALASLTAELKTQAAKAKKDAGLLKQIQDAVDKATSTAKEVKGLVDKLTESDTTAKAKLTALINSVGAISSIFKPKDA